MRPQFATPNSLLRLCRYAACTSFLTLLFTAPSAWSAIAFVQGNWSKSYDSSAPQTSFGSQSAGGLNVVLVSASGGASVTQVADSAGNAYELAGTTGAFGVVQYVYYAKNIVAAGTNVVTVTLSSPAIVTYLLVLEYSGLDPVSPFDGFAECIRLWDWCGKRNQPIGSRDYLE